ncbi:MAG TPA: hypothetical protein VI912_03680 [Candidatus Bilamarchaeaceae archaeon]|nr:hypothetical protein [Candidatus Bilamarchaeaceae archaeon]
MIVESQIRAIWVTLALAFFLIGVAGMATNPIIIFIAAIPLSVACLFNLYRSFQKK